MQLLLERVRLPTLMVLQRPERYQRLQVIFQQQLVYGRMLLDRHRQLSEDWQRLTEKPLPLLE